MSDRSVLIVGCGYLGRRVAQRLVAAGESVWGTTRSADKARELELLGVRPIVVDLLKAESLEQLPPSTHLLFLASHTRGSDVPPSAIHVEGLRSVLSALEGSLRYVVYAGTVGVYGDARGESVDETTTPAPRTESAAASLSGEALATGWPGVRGIVLRFAGFYGPGRIPGGPSLSRGDPIPGDPAAWLNLIHIDDAAEATVAVLSLDAGLGVLNVVDERPTTRAEYYATAARLLNAPPPRFGGSRDGRKDADRRVDGRRLRERTGLALRYPDITVGLPASLTDEPINRSPRPVR